MMNISSKKEEIGPQFQQEQIYLFEVSFLFFVEAARCNNDTYSKITGRTYDVFLFWIMENVKNTYVPVHVTSQYSFRFLQVNVQLYQYSTGNPSSTVPYVRTKTYY